MFCLLKTGVFVCISFGLYVYSMYCVVVNECSIQAKSKHKCLNTHRPLQASITVRLCVYFVCLCVFCVFVCVYVLVCAYM